MKDYLTALMWRATLPVLVLGLISGLASAGQVRRPGPIPLGRPAACCGITAININTGVVSAKENVTGRNFQFKVNDTTLLNSLKIGQGVYANFTTNQVSLDGSTNCCAIIPPQPAPAAPALVAVPAPAARTPAPVLNKPVANPPAARPAYSTATPPAAAAPVTSPSPATGGSPAPAVNKPATSPAAAPTPLAPCCGITAIDAGTGVVTATENATSKSFQFKLNDATQLKSLNVGKGVYANFAANVVSLEGVSPDGIILSAGAAPAPPPLSPGNSTGARTGAGGAGVNSETTAGPSLGHVATPQGAINLFRLDVGVYINGNIYLNSALAVEAYLGQYIYAQYLVSGSLPPSKNPYPNTYVVDFAVQNVSNTTLQNVPIQLVITPSGGGPDAVKQETFRSGGPADTMTQVITSWAPDGPSGYNDVQFSWSPPPGTYTLTATIDPNNQFGESSAMQASHSASIQITQPASTYVAPPPSMILNPADAGPASSIFSFNIQNRGNGLCTGSLNPSSDGVIIDLNLPNPVTTPWEGCTANATLYKGVTLRNGWTVKEVMLTFGPFAQSRGTGGFSTGTISPDPTGGTSLEMQFQSIADEYHPHPSDTLVQVTIQGPPGTTPFGNAPPTGTFNPSALALPRLKAAGFQHRSFSGQTTAGIINPKQVATPLSSAPNLSPVPNPMPATQHISTPSVATKVAQPAGSTLTPAATSAAAPLANLTAAPAAAPMAVGEIRNKLAHGQPCCGITAINTYTGVVTATENATGKSFQFKVADSALLNSLKVGQGIYANFAAGQVSVDNLQPCCGIIASTSSAATSSAAMSAAAPMAVGEIRNKLAPGGACCGITAIDTGTGVVTAKDNKTGNVFEFNLKDSTQLNSLQIGQGVYANFAAKMVSLNGNAPAGSIIAIQPAMATSLAAAAPAAVGLIGNKLAPGAPCCAITAIDTGTGVVTATEIATGRSIIFQIAHFQPVDGAKLSQAFPAGSKVDFRPVDGAAMTSGSSVRLTVEGFQPVDGIVTSVGTGTMPSAASAATAAGQPPPLPPAGSGTSSPTSPGSRMVANPNGSVELRPNAPIQNLSLEPNRVDALGTSSFTVSGPCQGSLWVPLNLNLLELQLVANPVSFAQPFQGCTMSVQMYQGIRLTNGWTVADASIELNNAPSQSASWIRKPSGSSLQSQVAVVIPECPGNDGPGRPMQCSNSTIIIGVNMNLHGPQGSNPYPKIATGGAGPPRTVASEHAGGTGSTSGSTPPPAPTFSPAGDKSYTAAQLALGVSISDSAPGAAIHYTTDGSTPTISSSKYSGTIPVRSATTIKAIAASSGMSNSAVSTATYRVCPAVSVLEGVDVSNYNGTVDWNKVRASGRTFAYALATESTNSVDPTFAQNYSAIKAAGLLRGAYHHFHSDVDPTMEADYFVRTIGALQPGDLPPVLDLESTDGQSSSLVAANVLVWMAKVQSATGRTPILYTSPAMANQLVSSGLSGFLNYPTWVANWGVSCPDLQGGWQKWTLWQYTGSGTVPGISGTVDLNRFNGTLTDLKALAYLSK